MSNRSGISAEVAHPVRLRPRCNRRAWIASWIVATPSGKQAVSINWLEMGGRIWLDVRTKLNHLGSYDYKGDIAQLIK